MSRAQKPLENLEKKSLARKSEKTFVQSKRNKLDREGEWDE